MMEKTSKKRSRNGESETKKKSGRPPVVTKDALAKLERAFSMGLPDEQACLYAEIDPSTLYRYQEKNPRFCERKRLLKQNVTMHARINIAERIQAGSIEQSWLWLERKEREEFCESPSVQIANQNVLIQLPPMQLPNQNP